MIGSKTWTRTEAISRINEILVAAEQAPQFVTTPKGRFTISFQKIDAGNIEEILFGDGPLEIGDFEE